MPNGTELFDRIVEAQGRIAPHVRRTWLEHSPQFSEISGAQVYFKYENLQHTGSFKLRGAVNRLLSLSPSRQRQGLVAASTGNHGKAVAFAARKFNSRAVVFVPREADAAKVQAIRQLGAEVRVAGTDCVESERAARQYALQNDMTYISPYNDLQVVAGQGVIGQEIFEQRPDIDAVFVSMGGGGLIGGIGGFLKTRLPRCQVVACSPENSMVMAESLRAGRLLELPSTETLSDGTAGGVEQDSITFGLCQQLVDRCVTVSEPEIRSSLRQFVAAHGMLIEGAAAVAIAGLLKARDAFRGRRVVVVLCGANIGLEKLRQAIAEPADTKASGP